MLVNDCETKNACILKTNDVVRGGELLVVAILFSQKLNPINLKSKNNQ